MIMHLKRYFCITALLKLPFGTTLNSEILCTLTRFPSGHWWPPSRMFVYSSSGHAWVLQECSVFSVDTEYWEEILALNQRRRIHTFYERLPSPFSRFEHSLLTYELAEFQKFDHKSCVEDKATSPQQDLPMQELESQGNQQLLFHREQRAVPTPILPSVYTNQISKTSCEHRHSSTDSTRAYWSYTGQES